jgi:uncharacterized damage-inducible protein DinB
MNKETQSIIRNMQNILSGEPWFGRPVMDLLNEIDPAIVYKKPNSHSHSLAELLYHMLTWAEFTLRRIEKDEEKDLKASEKEDWRKIDPGIHTWNKGIHEFKTIHEKIMALLQSKDDAFLDEKVNYRQYNFRFLLNGLIQHDIYHIGQIAYVKKLLE